MREKVQRMKINKKGLDLIKEFEGCQLKAYKDAAGIWTIGWGTTNADKSITGKTIRSGMKITQETADEWLIESLDKKYMPLVMMYDDKYNWTENEASALCSFAYNIGSIKQLTDNGKRTKEQIAEKMLLYNKADGKVLRGLERRREAERKLFLTKTKSYYKKYTGSSYSIVDALKAVGVKDTSLRARAKIAEKNGIKNYDGTATQNLKMLELLKAGKLCKP